MTKKLGVQWNDYNDDDDGIWKSVYRLGYLVTDFSDDGTFNNSGGSGGGTAIKTIKLEVHMQSSLSLLYYKGWRAIWKWK